ncbi:MAG: gamma-glutamyltransferase, partial [Bacteroidota bacterium]
MRKLTLLVFLCLFNLHCKKTPPPTGLVAEKAMVVSAREEASKIGADIMKKGGNAFDAMVATEMALAVAYPFAGNLGGGGFMVYRKENGQLGGLDYREKAPLSAHKDMYLDSLGNVIPEMSTVGATAVGVPGTVAGIIEVHQKFGSLPLEEILQPVIALAKKGVIVTKKQAIRLKSYKERFINVNGDSTKFAQQFKAGDTIFYPELANTLVQIMEKGRDGFYKGEVAQKLSTFIQDEGGFVTQEDLAAYEAKWRQPVVFPYKDLK